MLSDEAIQEYKAIYRQIFNEDTGDAEAREQAESLIRLMKVIYQPIPANRSSEPES